MGTDFYEQIYWFYKYLMTKKLQSAYSYVLNTNDAKKVFLVFKVFIWFLENYFEEC